MIDNYSIDSNFSTKQIFNSKEISITKYIIKKDVLEKVFWELRNNHAEYTIDYLYNPYLFLQG